MLKFQHTAAQRRLRSNRHILRSISRFNTQPPEGGWQCLRQFMIRNVCFNTQPPEGGWVIRRVGPSATSVSTHSRPKAAGSSTGQYAKRRAAFQHTAARRRLGFDLATNYSPELFQHTAARRRLARGRQRLGAKPEFQHTAARRRLAPYFNEKKKPVFVSTHSRPKAAGLG